MNINEWDKRAIGDLFGSCNWAVMRSALRYLYQQGIQIAFRYY